MARNEAWKRAARSLYWREDEARAVITAWKQSGETVAEFCRANGVAAARLSRWLVRLEGPTDVRFHPVRLIPDSSVRGRAEIEVALSGGVAVRLAPGFDAEDLRRVLAVLGVGVGC
jgi:hypothetical protein